METIKPRIFKGTRDFLPEEMIRREEIVEAVRGAFRRYGFLPVETPAIEFLDVLLGKYGEEGDKLIYRLAYEEGSTLALRYDQTVPLCRLIAMYHGQLQMPFKRYQVQPVWRADRPQKGRFREFVQMDADTVGTDSYLADAEIIALTADIFSALRFPSFVVKINHRKALRLFTLEAGLPLRAETDVCRCIDKLDKIGREGVAKEMRDAGIGDEQIAAVFSLLLDGGRDLDSLAALLAAGEETHGEVVKGVSDLVPLYRQVLDLGVRPENAAIDLALARGLDYYTGPIFETVIPALPGYGSVSGGGRYDSLIGAYSGIDIPATGVSFGLDRIFATMAELGLLTQARSTTAVLVVNFGGPEAAHAFRFAALLRGAGVPTEVYLEPAKLKKQFSYADRKGIPIVAVIGGEEAAAGTVSLKDMTAGSQETLPVAEAVAKLAR